MIIRAIVIMLTFALGFLAGWRYLRLRTLKDLRRITHSFLGVEAAAERLADIIARVSPEELARAENELAEDEGRELLEGYIGEKEGEDATVA